MKKIKSGFIKIKDIKHLENSRIQGTEDVSDLMQDIEQRGLLQNIGIRISDNAIIYGNRRARAFELLGYEVIPCDFYEGMDDTDLILTNLTENLKRRKIGSIEIGRIVNILMEKGMTQSEISVKLGISRQRVQTCSSAYNIAGDTKFMELITQKTTSQPGITESLLWKIQNAFHNIRFKPTKQDWNIILSSLEKEKITNQNVPTLKVILMNMENPNLIRALEDLEDTKVVRVYVPVKRIEWDKLKASEKIESDTEIVKNILNKYNNKILF